MTGLAWWGVSPGRGKVNVFVVERLVDGHTFRMATANRLAKMGWVSDVR